ncbi:DUF4145 domain-containing protein [Bradyrhizobium tropiciagri]|nr:DUF4145 domain-containing protein [Bradyrhizobium tropiciagri]
MNEALQVSRHPQNSHFRLMANDNILIVRTYPQSREPIAHPTWPEEIREPFVDAQKMLSENKTPSFIIGGCRAVLDVATKKLGGNSANLAGRISELAQKGIITGGLREWADKLRLDGNNALHELKGDRDGAIQLVEFIRVFLHVAFELPAAIREKSPPDQNSETGE